ncbi:MAG: phage gp6-like head-tail connector protein [Alistipes sp.]|nr:phage gp6-like head-tail connector protein [Alistipes sp.]
MAYTSLELAKQHLNLEAEYTDDDALIQSYINAAEMLVHADVGESEADLVAKYGAIPAPLQVATLLVVGTFYTARETVAFGAIMQKVPTYDILVSKYRNYSR